MPEHFNLPWRLAINDNTFFDTGATVTYSDYPDGTGELTRALRGNELDIALVLTEGAVADILQNDKNRLVKVYVASPLTWGIHVAASSNIKRIAEIRGRRIAISQYGSGSHLIAIVDAGEFRRVGQREVPWPAFAVSVRRRILGSHGQPIHAVLDVVARYAINLKRRKTAPQLIADTYGIRTTDAEKWLTSVRWGIGYRRPTPALSRITKALQTQRVIATERFDPDRLWHHL